MWCQEFLVTEQLYKLNLLYGSFLEAQWEPFDIDIKGSLTIAYKNDDAFTLAAPLSSSIRVVKNKEEHDGDQFVLRCILPNTIAKRMENDLTFGYFFLSLVKNEVLKAFAEHVDLTKNKVIWARPGKPGEYFRELEGIGYEFRAYISKET